MASQVSHLPDLFVQDDQSTATVSTAEISSERGGTDVDISLLLYLRDGIFADSRTDVVKCFETFFQREKSG